jgi:hypothetical protein
MTMTRSIGSVVCVLTCGWLCLAAGEESPHEQTLKVMLASLNKLTAALAGVKDAETAQAARPELKKAADTWVAARAKADKLPPPEPAEKARLTKQYKPKMDEALKKLNVEVGRLQSVPSAKEALQELRPVLEPAKGSP